MMQLVIDRTFDGYMTEIKTVYGQLEKELGAKIEPAPDEWGRLFNVDFFIRVKDNHIGIQIKPVNQGIQLSQIFKEKDLQSKTLKKFTRQYCGKVFYVFSSKVGEKKEIRNKEVVKNPAAETAGRPLFECLFFGVIPAIPNAFGSRESFRKDSL